MKQILGFLLAFLICNTIYAGTGSSAVEKQTTMDYEECVNKIYFNTDSFYEIVDTKVDQRKEINRDKNLLLLSNSNAVGQSTFQAEESRNVTKERAIFELKMTKPINGNLKAQRTNIEIKNINGKAKIIIKMTANVEHFFASEKVINKELRKNAEKVILLFEQN